LRSTTIVTRLTEHDDVIKSLLRGAPRLGLALGPSSARAGPACEGSFSKLKLIKNYLRSGMSTLRLRNLATLSVEQQLTDNINFDIAIEEFANKKARKVTV